MARTGNITGRQLNLGTRIRARLARANIVGSYIIMPNPEGNVLIDRRTLVPDLSTLARYRVLKKEALP